MFSAGPKHVCDNSRNVSYHKLPSGNRLKSHWKKKKMTSAATAAGGGTGRRGGSDRQREENNWPEATREREVTWLLSWPKAREGSSRKGWSPQSGSALRCSWWVPLLWPSSAPFSPPPLSAPFFPALLPVTAHHIGTKWSALTSARTRVIVVAVQRLGPLR